MAKNIVQRLAEINQKLGVSIFSVNMLEKYMQASQSCLIADFHDLINIKSFTQKLRKINQMSKIIPRIASFTQEEVSTQLSMNKKTDITKFMTLLLIPDSQNRLKLENIRKELVVDIRKKKQLNDDIIMAFEILYRNFYMISQDQKEICQKSNLEEGEYLKTLLISLKKMMGSIETQAISKPFRQDTYSINVDIKKIMVQVSSDFEGTQSAKMFSCLIEDSQKKWLGPRLHKLVQLNKWDFQSTSKLVEALKAVNVENQNFRSNPISLKKALKKIINNLKKYCTSLKRSRVKKFQIKNKEQKQNQKQQSSEMCLDLQNFEQELVNELQNEKLSSFASSDVMKDFTESFEQIFETERNCYQSMLDQLCLEAKKPFCFQ